MSDARWFEIDTAIAAAVRHFSWAVSFFGKIPGTSAIEDRHLVEMAFMHAMQSGHTSLEAALVRILDICGEALPTGANWHADLIRRAANPVLNRPAILSATVAQAADLTRRFRNIAVHAYDSFDYTQAREAVESAALLVSLLSSEIARFRQAIDP
jgi:ribonuclease HepT-like protein